MNPGFVRHSLALVLLLIAGFTFGQQRSATPVQQPVQDSITEFEIIKGPSLRMLRTDTGTLQTIAGGAIVYQGATKFWADSVVLNNDTRIMQAFGNVHINDGDTVNIYSQYLLYNGISRFAFLRNNVKLIGNNGTLYTEELDYSSYSGIGNYYKGGKIINKETTVTSRRGTYYADTKDVYFKQDVKMDGPKDHILADSLIYNMNDGNMTFVSETYVKNDEVEVRTNEGRYDSNTGDAFFSSRTNIKDSSGMIYTANNMAMEGETGNAQLEGNAVIIDSANGFNLIANQIFINQKNKSFLATQKPILIIKQKEDSVYMAADTIFSGLLANFEEEMGRKADSTTSPEPDSTVIADSLQAVKVMDSLKLITEAKDSIPKGKIIYPVSELSFDENELLNLAAGKLSGQEEKLRKEIPPEEIEEKEVTTTDISPVEEKTEISDTTVIPPDLPQKVGAIPMEERHPVEDSIILAHSGQNIDSSDTQKDSSDVNSDSTRYFIAYHHVKIFNDSLQSVCDSLFISSADSVFRLYRDPVIWSGNTQVKGDTIYLYTKNKDPEQLFVFDKAIVINRTTEGFFNQMGGKTLNLFFKDRKFDSLRLKGSPSRSIYYLQDKDSAYIGVDKSSGDAIDMLFDSGQLVRIIYINEVKSNMYPMGKIPDEEKELDGFEWLDARRPKNRAELFE